MTNYFTLTRITVIKNTDNKLTRMWKTWNPHTLLIGIYNDTIALGNRQLAKTVIIIFALWMRSSSKG